jgi:hypothetical protein
MRHLFVAASAIGLLLASGAALAQSGQGGYLGKDPGANAPSITTPQPPAQGSGQGGYLGKDPGGDATTSSGSGASGSGQGGYLGRDPGTTCTDPANPACVGQPRNQSPGTYGVPGKVGGSDRR